MSISSTKIDKPVLMIDVEVSKDKHINRQVDRKNLIYARWNRMKKKPCWRRWSIEEKEVRQWSKPVESTSKNLSSFLEISPVQKEVFLSYKLWDYAYE